MATTPTTIVAMTPVGAYVARPAVSSDPTLNRIEGVDPSELVVEFCDRCGVPVWVTVDDLHTWRHLPAVVHVLCDIPCHPAALHELEAVAV